MMKIFFAKSSIKYIPDCKLQSSIGRNIIFLTSYIIKNQFSETDQHPYRDRCHVTIRRQRTFNLITAVVKCQHLLKIDFKLLNLCSSTLFAAVIVLVFVKFLLYWILLRFTSIVIGNTPAIVGYMRCCDDFTESFHSHSLDWLLL